jgi:hypothetical protein
VRALVEDPAPGQGPAPGLVKKKVKSEGSQKETIIKFQVREFLLR